MEKLIQYLNEYLDDGQERLYACYPLDEDFDRFFHTKDGEGTIEEAQVISKKFGFIQRLVQNGNIDFDKCGICYEINSTEDHYNLENRQDLWLIMLLSISSSPIEDLISYLR